MILQQVHTCICSICMHQVITAQDLTQGTICMLKEVHLKLQTADASRCVVQFSWVDC